ncbi:UNVERIFIED_CONTAM: hypothetical protein Sindi_0476400, partial [Sesamum indicum]
QCLVYIYGGDLYDYVFGLADRFQNVVHATKQPFWSGCNPISIGFVAELVNIKIESHISQHIYDRISQKAAHKLARDYTLPIDYYSTKKFIRDLGLL